jgi:hypothetical protein
VLSRVLQAAHQPLRSPVRRAQAAPGAPVLRRMQVLQVLVAVRRVLPEPAVDVAVAAVRGAAGQPADAERPGSRA